MSLRGPEPDLAGRIRELEAELVALREELAEARAQVNVFVGYLSTQSCPPEMEGICEFSHGNCVLWANCWKSWAAQAGHCQPE